MNYTDVKVFMESIKNNDIFAIKSDLEGLIVLFKGDKVKCDEAVEYAINNSSFNWEEDDGIFFGEELNSVKDVYCYEKERLVQNFTKERYLNVLELYKQYDREETKKEQEILKETRAKKTEEKGNSFENNSIKRDNGLKKSEIKESQIKSGSSSTSNSYQNRGNRKNVGLDQEDKVVFQRAAMLGLVIIVVVGMIIKIVF
ncbi:MAG: hypothetical protein ACRDBY_15490 [Cetobacterium sp.]